MKTTLLSIAAILTIAGTAAAQGVRVFDNMTGNVVYPPSSTVAAGNTAGTGNRFIGQAVTLSANAGSPLAITGFDLDLFNQTGAALAANTTLRLQYWVWNTWNNGATGANPAFSDLLGSGFVDVVLATTLNNGANRFIQNATPGSAPAIVLSTPIEIATPHTIGLTFAWQRNLTGQFAYANGLTSGITGGTSPAPTGIAPVIGSVPNQPASKYYRSNNLNAGDGNGNFRADSAFNFGTSNSAMLARVYAIPTPATAGVIALMGLGAARRRRS